MGRIGQGSRRDLKLESDRDLIENIHILHPPTCCDMTNFKVLLEGAWLVRDVKSVDDAIGVAISEAGKRLNNKKLDFVEVEMGQTICPACGESLDGVFMVAGTALVGLLFEIKVYDAENEEHAFRIAKAMVGKALGSVPLKLVETEEIEGGRTGRPERSR